MSFLRIDRNRTGKRLRTWPLLVLAALVLPLLAGTARGQTEDWEWDPSWGYHEEEWYDPSDWFNNDAGVDYEDYAYEDNAYEDNDTEDWEWDPTWGYHEEEWYDPSDWFNNDAGVDYEDYGNYYYTSDWYDDEPDFDNWWYGY